MTLSTDSLRAAVAAIPACADGDLAALPRPDLLAVSRAIALVRRESDLLMAQLAGEIDQRSQGDIGTTGLAAREGFRSARELIASTLGGSVAEASRLVTAGKLIAQGDAVSVAHNADAGAGLPVDSTDSTPSVTDSEAGAPTTEAISPREGFRAELARCARSHQIGMDVVALFASTLERIPNTPRAVALLQRALSKAPGLPLHRVREVVWRAQAAADPEAWAEREERQRDSRHVVFTNDADGMVVMTARLTPIDSAAVRTFLDAGVRRIMQMRRDDPGSDNRTPGQMRADLLVSSFQHMLDCDAPTSGVKTTVVVRISQEDLAAGSGVGEIDGLEQPVSVRALRAAAVDAEIIPAVLGGESEVLDWGRAKRLFTAAQRLALVERDGGCAFCHAPPSWCEAHHIRWWERDSGPTDLVNGVLLCVSCHHRVHRDGWEIRVRDGVVWFTPPSAIDPTRTPRIGGRARFGLVA